MSDLYGPACPDCHVTHGPADCPVGDIPQDRGYGPAATCRQSGRDWAGRRMVCTLLLGHAGSHKGSHGGRLKVER